MDSNGSENNAAGSNTKDDKLRHNRSFSTNGFNSQDPLSTGGQKITQQQLTGHFLGFGSLPVDALSPKDKKFITNCEASGKFQEKVLKKQKQAEKMLLENRLRHLAKEDDRLQRQIRLAHKNSQFADQVRERKESDERLKAACQMSEANRIEQQNLKNNRRRNQTITNINSHQNQVFGNHVSSRNDLNEFLHANYSMFKSEKESEHFKRMQNASDQYTQRQEQNKKARNDRQMDYQATTMANVNQQNEHAQVKGATEAYIKKLEEQEMAMLNKMQTTLAQKKQAIDQLKGKSKALVKNLEPRGAYKLGRTSGQAHNSEANASPEPSQAAQTM